MISALLAFFALAGPLEAQQGTPLQRQQVIWGAANNRIVQQTNSWFEDGEFPICIELLRMQYELMPSNYDVATDLGWMLENVHQWEQAEAVYERFIRDNPQDPDARLPLAQYWYMRKKFEKVPPILEGHLESSAHPNNYRILAHSYERTGKLKESETTWKRYIALKPDDDAAKRNLERVQKKLAGNAH